MERKDYDSVETSIQAKQDLKPEAKAQKERFTDFVTKGLVQGNGEAYVGESYINDLINFSANNISVLRTLSNVMSVPNADSLDVIVDSDFANVASWEGQPEASNVIVKRNIKAYELFSQPKITQKLLDDTSSNAQEIILRRIAQNFARIENSAFLFGDGNNKPKGLLTYASGTDASSVEQIVGVLDYTSINNLIAALDPFFQIGAVFMMHAQTEQLIKNLQDNNGRYIYTSPNATEKAKIFGVDVVINNDMPKPIKGNLAITYGNLSYAYQIVDAGTVRSIRDPFTDKPFVKFYTTKKVGGALLDGRAVKLLKIA